MEGKDREGNNLTFMKEVEIKINPNVLPIIPEIYGHRCYFSVSKQANPLTISISHYGDKQPFQFPLTLTPTSTSLTYSKI